jgi:hypothetical protein
MAYRTIAAIAAGTIMLTAPAHADLNLGTPSAPATGSIWFQSGNVQVNDAGEEGLRFCAEKIIGQDATFGIATNGNQVNLFLNDPRATSWLGAASIRLQVDNHEVWTIVTHQDQATTSMLVSDPINRSNMPTFWGQLIYGRQLALQTSQEVYTFSLARAYAGGQALLACEDTLRAKRVQPAAPAKRL